MFLQATREDLEAEFSKYGKVDDVFVPVDRETGRMKGFAFVTFSNKAEAESAINGLHGYGGVVGCPGI
jgi:RNA recognition motif-containing protein